jgi:ATP-dependent Clp protease ATP-binding subunit ClpA
MMKTYWKDLAIAQEQWEEDAKNNRIEVTDNVADVVSMMSGIPVNRIAQTESNKLANYPNSLKEKLLAKEKGDENCTFYSKKSCRIKRSESSNRFFYS